MWGHKRGLPPKSLQNTGVRPVIGYLQSSKHLPQELQTDPVLQSITSSLTLLAELRQPNTTQNQTS